MNAVKPRRSMKPPKNRLRRAVHRLVSHWAFDCGMLVIIGANVGQMACDFWEIEQPEHARFKAYFDLAAVCFTYVYYVEGLLKLTALGTFYFVDGWCRFDFFLICTMLLDQFARALLARFLPIPPMLIRILRLLRILRILRLLRGAKG